MTIPESALRRIFERAVVKARQAAEYYERVRSGEEAGWEDEVMHCTTLGWIAAGATEMAWDQLVTDSIECRVSIASAIHDLVGWAASTIGSGFTASEILVTWYPSRAHTTGSATPEVIQERMELLRADLSRHGVSISTAGQGAESCCTDRIRSGTVPRRSKYRSSRLTTTPRTSTEVSS